MPDLKEMLVKDVLTAIENKEISIKQLSGHYNVSDRTIQNKIKKAGFKWHPSKAVYEFVGDEAEQASILISEFDSLFTSINTSNSEIKSESNNKSISNSTKTSQSEKEIASTTDNTIKNGSKSSQNGSGAVESDIIDILLSGKQANSKRAYRGFYFDPDVLEIVDRASNKSELINQALRKVFRDKGLL